ncbi:MAG TPA: DUF6597 domain-containing transcriptional factor [Acidimicrobiales bacterium]|nr:DUF6597 domain-containing transcriptional factor [Acidimicrobiales bacterium]
MISTTTSVAGYREWRPAAALARHVACTWVGWMGPAGETYVQRVLPDGCLDLVWDGERLVVAGPDTGPVDVAPRPDGFLVGIRFRPGLAPTVLGLPASELRDLRVDAADALGADRAGRLSDRLASTIGPVAPTPNPSRLRAMAGVLEESMSGWISRSADPDPVIEAAVAALRRPPPGTGRSVAALADDLNLSERQLHRRCCAAVGYGPKTLDRVLRFRRFLALADARHDVGLARLAVEAGYTDQPHLNRECRRLAGTTPALLLDV